MKVSDIFSHALDKNYEQTIEHLLYKTNLIKDILEISKDKAVFTYKDSGNHSTYGYMCFVRKLANKLVEMQQSNTEVNNCLESIPEWKEYEEQILKPTTEREKKPLASDPRNKPSKDEDDLEFFFRLKSFNPTKGNQN